ncbi:hypothetical protein BVRB_2g035650 [Beta vulgaris subsp. vulgaris]|nr:hypothetical protein BVRB_2g035650 [Beta vulgaris subsp. vulgaris]
MQTPYSNGSVLMRCDLCTAVYDATMQEADMFRWCSW